MYKCNKWTIAIVTYSTKFSITVNDINIIIDLSLIKHMFYKLYIISDFKIIQEHYIYF